MLRFRSVDGSSAVDHLAAHARATGEVPPELEVISAGPPAGTESLWAAFTTLHGMRSSNGFGPSPLSLSDIQAYATLYGIEFTPWELDVIVELDTVALTLMMKKKGGRDGV